MTKSTGKLVTPSTFTVTLPRNRRFTEDQRLAIQQTACELYADGKTIAEIAAHIGIDAPTIRWLKRNYPSFNQALDQAAADGSVAVLEQMKCIPWEEPNAHLARVKIEALCKYLEMRWPDRYGKRLDVTVKTLDLGPALERAQQNARRIIESVAYSVVDTDTQSVSGTDAGIDDLL